MGLSRVVLICTALGLICGKAHGSGSSTDVLLKTPGETVVFNTAQDPTTPYTYLTWEFFVHSFSFIIVTANESVITIRSSYRDRVTLFDDGSLELRNLTLQDALNYRVNITSAEGPEVSTVYQLIVQKPVSDVIFSPDATDLIENKLVIFRCAASGSELKFSFYNSTDTFPAIGDYLDFVPSRNHTGPWGCEAYNLVSRAKSQKEFNFTFSYGPDDATLEAFPSLDVYPDGSTVTLRCTVFNSKPMAEISWKSPEGKLPFTGTELVLDPLKHEDRGTYQCVAHNKKTDLYAFDYTYISVDYPSPEQPLSDGAIAGIAIACIVVAFGSSAVVFYLINRKK